MRFVERFASTLEDAGVPRMPSRVFAALLATDSGRLTAAELGERLCVSPAAVSGAMRYLIQAGLARRERQPGSRRDVYQVYDDAWYESLVRRDEMLARWENELRAGAEALGGDTPAGQRMHELETFMGFMREQLPGMLERWREHREQLRSIEG